MHRSNQHNQGSEWPMALQLLKERSDLRNVVSASTVISACAKVEMRIFREIEVLIRIGVCLFAMARPRRQRSLCPCCRPCQAKFLELSYMLRSLVSYVSSNDLNVVISSFPSEWLQPQRTFIQNFRGWARKSSKVLMTQIFWIHPTCCLLAYFLPFCFYFLQFPLVRHADPTLRSLLQCRQH